MFNNNDLEMPMESYLYLTTLILNILKNLSSNLDLS